MPQANGKGSVKDKVFVEITNSQIYKKLCDIDRKLNLMRVRIAINSWAVGLLFALVLALVSGVLD